MRIVLALVLALVAAVLPTRATAVALVGGDEPHLDVVTTGVLLFKALLLLHALVLALAPRYLRRLPREAIAPLLRVRRDPDHGDISARQAGWAVGVILAIGAALRLHDLGTGLWFDEILTLVQYARLPVGAIVSIFDSQNQHMLYSLLAHGAISAFGDGAWALRLPAALFGVASLWATYWFGSHITSRRESVFAAALLAVSYHHVWFSQNARGYTGLLFWTLVTSALFVRLVRERSGGSWGLILAFAATSALAAFTHISAIFVTVAQFLVWLGLVARGHGARSVAWRSFAGFVLSATLTLQLYALTLPQMLGTVTEPTMAGVAVAWKSPLWFVTEALRGLQAGVPGGLVTVAGAMAIGLAGLASYWRRGVALVGLMLLPGVVTGAAMFLTEHNLWPRLFFFSAGFAVLIAVRGVYAVAGALRWERAPALASAALVLLAVGSAATLPRAYRPKQDFVSARDYVERARHAGDAVVTVDLTRFPYERYLGTSWLSAEDAEDLAAIEARHERTWVLYTFPARLRATQPALWERLQTSYTRAADFPGTVGGGDVVVMVRG